MEAIDDLSTEEQGNKVKGERWCAIERWYVIGERWYAQCTLPSMGQNLLLHTTHYLLMAAWSTQAQVSQNTHRVTMRSSGGWP